jgi:hypothetical protein
VGSCLIALSGGLKADWGGNEIKNRKRIRRAKYAPLENVTIQVASLVQNEQCSTVKLLSKRKDWQICYENKRQCSVFQWGYGDFNKDVMSCHVSMCMWQCFVSWHRCYWKDVRRSLHSVITQKTTILNK